MNLLNVNNLGHAFGGRSLFKKVNFGIAQGERVGLVGPNGAGKSTLLKILMGQISPDDGEVVKRRGLKIGFLDQMPQFKPAQTIMQVLVEDPEDYEALGAAYTWLSRLELDRFGEDFIANELSGGWQKRLALARELMREPDLLLLDEPTNHLDVQSILWLEEFLLKENLSLLMVTHDRLFLQRVVNKVLDLDPRNVEPLLVSSGDYAQYLATKEQLLAGQQAREDKMRNTLRRETEWLRRGAKARQTKQQARIQSAQQLGADVAELKMKNRKQVSEIEFGDSGRAPKKLIEGKSLTQQYGDRVLFSDLNLLIGPRTRLAILGENGCGKSTLIRILLGLEKPVRGEVSHADDLQSSYFEQARDQLDPEKSVLASLAPDGDYVNFQGTFVHVRSYLDRFLFYGNKAELPVKKLSGGERARLRLAQLMLNPAQVLILDEPTNDLDLETLEMLEQALAEFPGAVLLITHDRYFMDAVADQILAFPPVGAEAAPHLVKLADYFQWETWYSSFEKVTAQPPSATPAAAPAPETEPRRPATKVKLSFKEKAELEGMEKVIHAKEAELRELEARSTESETLKDHVELKRILARVTELQSEIEKLYSRWSELDQKAGLSN